MLTIDNIQSFFGGSPAVKLLRAKSAPKILSFFYHSFKESQVSFLTEEKIIDQLADFLKEYDIEADENDENGELVLPDFETKARQLIDVWIEKGFLRNYESPDNEFLYELSSHSERVIQWMEQLETREFVGTESRFKDIFNKLQELVANTTEDAGTKIRELEAQKKKIDREIKGIKDSGKVSVYDDYQIKSRVVELTRSAKELLSDFKEVEDNFKGITRNIYLKHTDPSQTKGAILGYTFDSLEELKESDQGKSFYAFWEFLISRNRQDQWKDLVRRVFEMLEERGIRFDDAFLRKIKRYLYRSGKKVNDANDRMSEKLSRVISEKELAERLRVKEAINRIKELALRFIERDRPPPIGIGIEEIVPVAMPLEKKLNLEQSETPVFDHQPGEVAHQMDAGKLAELYSPYVVDKKELRERIRLLLTNRQQVSLKEVIDVFPLEKGLSELLAYFSLADRDYNHVFNTHTVEMIQFDTGRRKYIQVPQVIFTKGQ
ncbi:MAG: DUF3375 domain-containing protein [bacterium]|nr:DUF3375 domain-containing protein [bacterium]